MSLLKNLSNLVNEKAADAEKQKKTDHEKQEDSIKNKVNPYMKGVPATADYGNLSKNDVHSLLSAAEEKDDDVETVTFGLETEEGDIVKVYVNVEDADKFEEALSKMLGQEDDIEKVLDELSQDFDIVDVKWPDTAVVDDEPDKEDHNEDDEETAAEKLLNTGSEDNTEDEVPVETTTKTEEKQGMNGLGDSFFRRVLGEARAKPAEKDDKEEAAEIEKNIDDDKEKKGDPVDVVMAGTALDFQRELSNRYQRLAFQTAHLLGIPMSILTLKRGTYKRNLRGVSEKVIDNSQLRLWLKRLSNELAKAEIASIEASGVAESVNEAGTKMRDTLQTKIQREIYDLFIALGVPEDAIIQRRSQMRNLIVTLGVMLQKKQRLRVTFRMVLSSLGINDIAPDELKESTELVFEDADQDDLLSKFNNKNTYGVWLFLKIATSLGIPATLLNSKLTTYKAPLTASLRGKSTAVLKLIAFAEVMGIDVTQPVLTRESIVIEKKSIEVDDVDQDTDPDTAEEVKTIVQKATAAEDLGEWNVGKSGDSTILSIADKKIVLDDEQYEKVINAMADAKAVSLLVNNIRVSFKPEHHGKKYVVKWNETRQTYPNGVLMSDDSIQAVLNAGSAK